MATRLFVGNLPEITTESELRAAFSSYGEITTLDLKTKAGAGDESKKFAFVSIAGSNYDIEACIKHYTHQDFNGSRLHVTRARESFLERLQREREQAQKKETEKHETQELPKFNPIIKHNEKLNPRKRNFDFDQDEEMAVNFPEKTDFNQRKGKLDFDRVEQNHVNFQAKKTDFNQWKRNFDFQDQPNAFHAKKPEFQKQQDYHFVKKHAPEKAKSQFIPYSEQHNDFAKIKKTENPPVDKKKQDSDNKRMESMKQKRLEFKNKQMIIKTGLTAVDKAQNTKIVFDDDTPMTNGTAARSKGTLFDDDDDSGDGYEVDFSIKEQFEGKRGQKVLDLQSRYKSDKRFTLDERFIDNANSDEEAASQYENEAIEVEQVDEKNKQLDILQDVLGITLKRKMPQDENSKIKPKLGMLRFDPSQPDHAKFLAPVAPKKQETNKKGKKKLKEQEEETQEQRPEEIRPEVSKEQFYKVSETLKEAIAQPTTFSLRSLFGNNETVEESKEDQSYLPLDAPKKTRVRNPFESKEKNPFVYDSSESENEDEPDTKTDALPAVGEPKAVWKENLFFSDADLRLKEGLAFFTNVNEESHKERRELKSLVKKRIYNKERKNQMFKKKIGGRRKMMKKSFRKNT